MMEFQAAKPSKKTSKSLVFTVVNDLNYDQRMQRICGSLTEAGYEVTLIGRVMANSKPLKERAFHQKRMKVWFSRGKLFYLEYNLKPEFVNRVEWCLLDNHFYIR